MFQLMKDVMNLNQTISLRTTLKNNSLINSPGIVLKPNKHVMDIFYGQRSHGQVPRTRSLVTSSHDQRLCDKGGREGSSTSGLPDPSAAAVVGYFYTTL